MDCPRCGRKASLVTPDYGYGYGAEFACYTCSVYGARFTSSSHEARAESSAARGASAANAQAYRNTNPTTDDEETDT